MRIILIGYMGSGKSTYAKVLSSRYNIKAIDTDNLIEEVNGKTISELFKEKGESYFRECESELIEHLKKEKDLIIAVGGGLPCHNDNMRKLKEIGFTVYLKVGIEELVSRLEKSHQKRPLVQGKNHEQLTEYVTKTLKEREIYYNTADLIFDAESDTNYTLLGNIIEMVLR